MEDADLEECLQGLSAEAQELYLTSSIPVLESIPTPLEFYRDWVSANKPVIIRGATDHWPARTKWTNQYLREKIGHKEVSVAVTPNGYADAPCQGKFVMPEERVMTFGTILDILDKKKEIPGIFYVQKQNSSFTDEFQELVPDAESHIPWANEAFGKNPDAVNFWMGDEKAITSMHKDHYENLYCVVKGYKTFILIPPTDQAFLPYEEYQAAVYKETSLGHFDVIDDPETGKVPWVSIDPLAPDLTKYPQYRLANPRIVRVDAGETLYLPSLWFHHVQQSHGCIAVNYWYDMEYDIKYNYFKFVEGLVNKRKKAS